jgi:cytochrome c biogenesis protein CcmG/thiol:disulfide interchange protein DsbE
MSPRVAVILGLLAGLLTAGLLVVGFVAFASELSGMFGSASASASPSQAPSAPPATATPTAGASPSAAASPSPTLAASSPGSASPSASAAASASVPVAGTPFRVGKAAPKLKLPVLGGGTLDLATLKGKPVWINFMATWCPPCRDEFPLMQGFEARYAQTGLTVVAVDVAEDPAVIAAFVKELGVTFPIALDGTGAAQRAWGAAALPVHVWIDAGGIVRYAALGGLGPDIMAEGLRSILPGVKVTT